MADKNDDGHSPETCTYQRCGASAKTPCPFVRDGPPPPDIDLPRYLPGQVVIINLYNIRYVVPITTVRQNEDGSWSYFGLNDGRAFNDEHVETLIRPQKNSDGIITVRDRGTGWMD